MTTNTNRTEVWILSIHDRAPQGFLAFDIKEVLACLGSSVRDHSWLVTELDCSGEESQRLCEAVARVPGRGVLLTMRELLVASAKFYQTIDATLIGIPTDARDLESLHNLSPVEWILQPQAEIVIRAVDSSLFEIMTKNPEHVRALQTCFKDVRMEAADKYFVASDSR